MVSSRQASAPPTASVRLPHASASVRSARHQVAEDLARRGLPAPVIEDSLLVVSEILSNALKHAPPRYSGDVRVSWDVSSTSVEIEVSDGGGSTRPYLQAPSLSALGGRGLAIVATICAEWGVRQDTGGSTVWATLPFGA